MEKRRKRQRLNKRGKKIRLLALLIAAGGCLWFVLPSLLFCPSVEAGPEWAEVQLIGKDGAARSGNRLACVRDVVIHYVGNPGTTAQQNRDYFDSPASSVSSHFVIGLDGEVIQCLPLDEQSSASNWRNHDTISIEVCHPDDSGAFTEASYESLVKLTVWLCDQFGLREENLLRHYDVTQKNCPLYYVTHEDAWEQFKLDVSSSGAL